MSNLETIHEETKEAKAAYEAAYEAYLKAEPGRDLTIKQGQMHFYRTKFREVLERFFDEYEKSGVL